MKEQVNFRKATIDDITGIVELCNECFEENTNLEKAKEIFKRTENNENEYYLVGIINEKIIAHSKITVIPTIYENMGTYAILNHVCVKPELRRHKIGTLMLQECEKIAKSKNCKAMELWSMNFRIAAHECYKKYGFVVNDAKFFSKEI